MTLRLTNGGMDVRFVGLSPRASAFRSFLTSRRVRILASCAAHLRYQGMPIDQQEKGQSNSNGGCDIEDAHFVCSLY